MSNQLFRIRTDRVELVWRGPRSPGPRSTNGELGRLTVRCRRPQAEAHLRVECAGIDGDLAGLDGAGPRLFEETDYSVYVESVGDAAVQLRHRDPLAVSGLQSAQRDRIQFGQVNFRSQVGHSRFTVYVGKTAEFDFGVEVFPTKLDYESDYQSMLGEVEDLMYGLVLEYLRSTFSLGREQVTPGPSELEWLLLLEHVLQDLESALYEIARRPRWGLVREAHSTPLARVRRPDATLRRAIRTGRGSGVLQALPGGGVARLRVAETRSQPSLDTPEHRWIATQLRRTAVRLAELLDVEHKRQGRYEGATSKRALVVLERLEALQGSVTRLERLEPIAAATAPSPPGFVSLLLLSSPGYSEAYRSLMMLQLGLRVAGGPLELSLKDLHLLYEYWTYLAVLRICADEAGVQIAPEQLLSADRQGLRVRLQRGRQHDVSFPLPDGRALDVTYNPLFRGNAYLVPQRPDIVVTVRERHWPRMRLLLDAKYRLDDSDQYRRVFGVPGPPIDAINTLHRYRDAILEDVSDKSGQVELSRTVIQGAILFPGAETEEGYGQSALFNSLETLGIGALPFLPGRELLVRSWIRSALDGRGWKLAARTLPHAALHRRASLLAAATEWVRVVDVPTGEGISSLAEWDIGDTEELAVLGSDPREVAVQWVTVLLPGTGSVLECRTAAVLIERVESRQGGLWIRLLHRGWHYEPLSARSLLNSRAGGPPRITSRLALLKAENIEELYVCSVPEWQLIDELRARGMPYEVVPPVPKVAESVPGAARPASIRVLGRAIRYRAGSFAISGPSVRSVETSQVSNVLRILLELRSELRAPAPSVSANEGPVYN